MPEGFPAGDFDRSQGNGFGSETGRTLDRRIDPALIDQFAWQILVVHHRLQNLRSIWAARMDVTGPQFLILTAIRDLDHNSGVSVSEVSSRLLVDASFVTTQSKALEKMGLLRRVPSKADARVVLMSLTDKARKEFGGLSTLQEYSNALAFGSVGGEVLESLNGSLRNLGERLSRAAVIVAADL